MGITRKGLFGLATGAAVAAAGVGSATVAAATARRQDQIRPAHRTLIRNADVITLDKTLGEITGADVLVDDGKIAAVGKGLSVGDAEVIDATGMILMPGMIDGHRHMWGGIDAGVVPKISPRISSYQDWKMRTMVCYTPEDAHLIQYAAGIMAIDSGVTSVIDFCHIFHTRDLAEQAARGILDSGIAGTFAYQPSHTPTYGPGDTLPEAQAAAERGAPPDENHWHIVEHLRRTLFPGNDGLLRFGLAPTSLSGRPIREIEAMYEQCRHYDPHILATHFHRNDTPGTSESYRQLAQLQHLMGPDYHVAHANGVSDAELAMMRNAGSMICGTTMGEHSYPHPSVHGRAQKAGVKIGIGMDSGVAFTHDYFQHLRGCFYNLFRTDEGKAIALSYEAEDVLNFVAGKAAAAIREDGVTGTIAVGQRADLLLLRTDRIGFPVFGRLAERVANYANQPDIDSVWIAGVARKREGRMIGVDLADLKRRMNAASIRINTQAATITFT